MSEKKNSPTHKVRGTLTFNDDESYNAYVNGDANFKNGLRNRDKGTLYRQPDFEEDAATYDDNDYSPTENNERTELTPEQQEFAGMLGTAIAVGLTWVTTEVVAPKVKHWWKSNAAPALQEKWNAVTGKKITVSKSSKETTTSSVGAPEITLSNVFYQELDDAYEKYATDMTSEEAQSELLDIFILSATIAAKVRKLSKAKIVDEKDMITLLTSPEYISCINQILQSNPVLLEEKTASLSKILGSSPIIDGIYVPIKNNQFKERLLVG
ncbi:hypothetical protein [Priestia koreensis]|uniref:hypothetical protein n=1 Tax=Priestia koreensis TaxID=284581 RepID=UPI001F55DA1A|nr:hypothetical protein [Priestia koreensis]UNL85268.1 hypothetical protein IE339_01630 [Priestia koreensis]